MSSALGTGQCGILCVIPIYCPDYHLLKASIEALKRHDVEIVLILNSHVDRASLPEDILCLSSDSNCGTAGAYNIAADLVARRVDLRALLLLDQDSLLTDSYLGFCVECVRRADWDELRTFVCPYDPKNLVLRRSLPVSQLATGLSWRKFRNVSDTKASGLLLPRSALVQLRFDEDLFVDYVDWNYCWRSHSFGFRVLEFPRESGSLHRLGNEYRWIGLNHLFRVPSLSRRKLQTRSALILLLSANKRKNAPLLRIVSVLSRLLINPLLDGLEQFGLIKPV